MKKVPCLGAVVYGCKRVFTTTQIINSEVMMADTGAGKKPVCGDCLRKHREAVIVRSHARNDNGK